MSDEEEYERGFKFGLKFGLRFAIESLHLHFEKNGNLLEAENFLRSVQFDLEDDTE